MNTQNLWLESKQYCKFICYLWSVACGCQVCPVIDNCHTWLSCCDKISPFYLKFRAYVLEPVYEICWWMRKGYAWDLLVDGAGVCMSFVGRWGRGMYEICWWMGQGYAWYLLVDGAGVCVIFVGGWGRGMREITWIYRYVSLCISIQNKIHSLK